MSFPYRHEVDFPWRSTHHENILVRAFYKHFTSVHEQLTIHLFILCLKNICMWIPVQHPMVLFPLGAQLPLAAPSLKTLTGGRARSGSCSYSATWWRSQRSPYHHGYGGGQRSGSWRLQARRFFHEETLRVVGEERRKGLWETEAVAGLHHQEQHTASVRAGPDGPETSISGAIKMSVNNSIPPKVARKVANYSIWRRLFSNQAARQPLPPHKLPWKAGKQEKGQLIGPLHSIEACHCKNRLHTFSYSAMCFKVVIFIGKPYICPISSPLSPPSPTWHFSIHY